MALAGKYGKICIGGTKQVASIKSWSLELSLDTLASNISGSKILNCAGTAVAAST